MKIVLVYQHFMIHGVGSTKPYDLARHLVRQGHEVTVICGRGYLSQGMAVPPGLVCRMEIEGIKLRVLGVEYRQKMGFARRLWAFASFTLMAMLMVCFMRPFDVLVASSTPLTVGLVGLLTRHLRRRPWVFEIRDLWPEFPVRAGYLKNPLLIRLSYFFEGWFYRNASAVAAISQRMRRRLIERGFDGDKIHFIPTGVDMTAFDNVPSAQEWWARQGLARDDAAHAPSDGAGATLKRSEAELGGAIPLRALYLGAHGPTNGLQYALEAAALLRPADRIKLVLVGDGVDKPRLVAQAKERKLTEIVFAPPVKRDLVPALLASCDVALLIDRVEPGSEYAMPNKLFDYIAAGKPTVTNTPAELWDHLRDAEAGLLVDNNNPQEFVDALRRLRDDRAMAARMGANALALARTTFDRAQLNAQWERLLGKVAQPFQAV